MNSEIENGDTEMSNPVELLIVAAKANGNFAHGIIAGHSVRVDVDRVQGRTNTKLNTTRLSFKFDGKRISQGALMVKLATIS